MPKVPLDSRRNELLGLKLSNGLLHGPFQIICATKYHVIVADLFDRNNPFIYIYNAEYTDEDRWASWIPN